MDYAPYNLFNLLKFGRDGFKKKVTIIPITTLIIIMFYQQDRLCTCMIWTPRQWRPRHGPTCLLAPLLFAGWSTIIVSMETTSPGSTQYLERWTELIQKMSGITSWTAPTLVSLSSPVCHPCFNFENQISDKVSLYDKQDTVLATNPRNAVTSN